MATTADYLTQLQKDKQTLVDNLVSKGVNASSDETFTFLVPKVAEIKSGSSEAKLEDLTITPTEEQQVFNHPGSDGYNNVIVNPIPDEYIIPTGTLEVTENGEYDVTEKDKVNVSVEATGGATITDCSYLFYQGVRTDVLNELLSLCRNATKMTAMFNSCKTLTELDLSGLDVSQVTNMDNTFNGSSNLTSLNLNGWDTSNVTSMNNLFMNCSKITELDLSHFDVSKVTSVNGVFNGCQGLISLNLNGWNTPQLTNMSYLFASCSVLPTIDLSSFTTTKVNNMSNMFYMCRALTSIDVSNFVTSKVTTMQNMFQYCVKLKSIDISNFDATSLTSSGTSNMFNNCSVLESVIINNPNVFPMTNTNMFTSTPIKNGTGYVYVPDDLVETYKSATNWSTYASQIKGISELPTEEV